VGICAAVDARVRVPADRKQHESELGPQTKSSLAYSHYGQFGARKANRRRMAQDAMDRLVAEGKL